MKVYSLSKDTIVRWQWRDPLLRHLSDAILHLVDTLDGRALDVGCGTGRVALTLAERGFVVDALDIEADIIEQAQVLAEKFQAGVNYFVADFSRPDPRFSDESYDLVVCSEVLEHVEQWHDVVRNAHRVLKPGGCFILTVPNDPGQFSILDTYGRHLRRYRWADLVGGLDGFAIESACTIGFPTMRAIHWTYARLALPLVLKEHEPDRMWRPGSFYERFGAEAIYRLAGLDRLFKNTKLGTTWVVKACKI